MKRKSQATAPAAGTWSWEELRSRHFPAKSDAASQRKLAEWAKSNGVDWKLQPETVRVGKSRRVRVVVLLQPRGDKAPGS